jgi:hypothetical protein
MGVSVADAGEHVTGDTQHATSSEPVVGDPVRPQSATATKLLFSYRFLRCGILAGVALLILSVAIEIGAAHGCVRESISDYFYSPVRTIFTGGMVAIGLCLVALQGERGAEEVCLNLAGMLAPVVAFIPTSIGTSCMPAEPPVTPEDLTVLRLSLQQQLMDGVRNNANAYLIVIAVVLVGLFLWPREFVRDKTRLGSLRLAVLIYAIAGAIVRFGLWKYVDTTDSGAHNASAIIMFVFFGVVVLINARFRSETGGFYQVMYWLVFAGMFAAAVLLLWVIPEFKQTTFALEAAEIGLFGLFWALQTIQFWGNEPTAGIKSA